MMETARASETSVDNYLTRQYIPEDKSELHIYKSTKQFIFKQNISVKLLCLLSISVLSSFCLLDKI
jgi:hypothetical protein